MAAVTLPISNTNVAAGLNLMPAAGFTVPAGHSQFQVSIDTSTYTAADQITVAAEFSQDNGGSWIKGGEWGGVGGAHVGRDGNPAMAGFISNIPPDTGQGVKVRAAVTVPTAGTLSGSVVLF